MRIFRKDGIIVRRLFASTLFSILPNYIHESGTRIQIAV